MLRMHTYEFCLPNLRSCNSLWGGKSVSTPELEGGLFKA